MVDAVEDRGHRRGAPKRNARVEGALQGAGHAGEGGERCAGIGSVDRVKFEGGLGRLHDRDLRQHAAGSLTDRETPGAVNDGRHGDSLAAGKCSQLRLDRRCRGIERERDAIGTALKDVDAGPARDSQRVRRPCRGPDLFPQGRIGLDGQRQGGQCLQAARAFALDPEDARRDRRHLDVPGAADRPGADGRQGPKRGPDTHLCGGGVERGVGRDPA